MTFFKIINTKMKPIINNYIFRYSHNNCLKNYHSNNYSLLHVPKFCLDDNYFKNKKIINLLGEIDFVDEASWEIKGFADENSLITANIIVNDNDDSILHGLLKTNNTEFIVNRCYSIPCEELLLLNESIMYNYINLKIYNLYVMENAKNRFTTCKYIQNCDKTKFIIYPLAAPIENKRRDINILIDN